MGKWIPWRISTTRSPPLYLIFLTCQVKCVGFIWGTFHGFLSPKAGTGFIKPIVCKLTVLVYVIYKYHLFLLPSRVFVFFNLYYTILIKSLWNINTLFIFKFGIWITAIIENHRFYPVFYSPMYIVSFCLKKKCRCII